MRYRQSLRYKINSSIALILLAVTLFFGAILTIYESQRRLTVTQEIGISLQTLSVQKSEQLGNEIFASQVLALEQTMDEIMVKKNFLAITVYDQFGKSLASTEPSARDNLTPIQIAAVQNVPISTKENWNGHSVLTFISPITAYGVHVGFWRIYYSLATLNRQTRDIVLIFSALLLTSATLTGFLLNKFLERFILKPVNLLRTAMQHIQGSEEAPGREPENSAKLRKLSSMIEAFDELPEDLNLTKTSNDEIGSLARSFRQMLGALKNAYIRMNTDSLTGLNNRMRLDEALKAEFDRAKRYSYKFAIIMVDIDYFKKVNDTYGHLVGDEVLKKIAVMLRDDLRSTDLLGRWGGEEFLILLPHQDLEQARKVAEKLRLIIEAGQFPEIGRITASLGVAAYSFEETSSDLVNKADDALYRAKHLGRNRVEVSGG